MSTKIRNLSIEKTLADDADYFIGDDPNNGATYKISKKNLFTGITASGGGGGLLTPSTVFAANYQTDFNDLKNHSCNVIGSPVISADKSPFVGGNSLYLPGNSSLEYAASSDFRLDSDWAVECFAWIPSSYATNNTYAAPLSISGGGMDFILGLNRSGLSNNGVFKQIYAEMISGSVDVECDSVASVAFSTWNHFFAVKISNILYFYVNGIFQTASLFPFSYKISGNPVVRIGYRAGISPLVGAYIAGCRIRTSGIKIPTLPFIE